MVTLSGVLYRARHCVGPVLTLGMEPRISRHNVRIVRRKHHRDRESRARVQVAQVIGQGLQLVCRELVVVLQHMVQDRARSAKETRVALDEEVELDRVHNRNVDNRTRSTIAAPVGILLAHGEEASVMALLDDDVCDAGV